MPGPQVTVQIPSQVQGILTPERGGSGYSIAAGQVLAEPWENTSSATIAIGSVVRRITDGTWRATGIEAVDDDTATDVLGVVVGLPDQGGHLDLSTAIPKLGDTGSPLALVAVSGVVPVLLAEAVSAGEWAAPTTTAGKAQGVAQPNSTTFGQFIEAGSSGGSARVRVAAKSGRPTPAGVSGIRLEAGNLSDAITVGLATFQQVDYGGTIIGCSMTTDAAGSVEIDVLKGSEAVVLATGTNSIFGGDYPSTSSTTWARMDPTSNWSTAVAIHDVFRLEIRSVTGTIKRVTVILDVRQF